MGIADNKMIQIVDERTREDSAVRRGGMCSWKREWHEAVLSDPAYGFVKLVDGQIVELTPEEIKATPQFALRNLNEIEFNSWMEALKSRLKEKF